MPEWCVTVYTSLTRLASSCLATAVLATCHRQWQKLVAFEIERPTRGCGQEVSLLSRLEVIAVELTL